MQAVLANVPRPMDFSLLRLAVVYLALLALWGLRPGAAAWHEAYLTHRAKYRPAVLVLGCMLCLLAAAYAVLLFVSPAAAPIGVTLTVVGLVLVSTRYAWRAKFLALFNEA